MSSSHSCSRASQLERGHRATQNVEAKVDPATGWLIVRNFPRPGGSPYGGRREESGDSQNERLRRSSLRHNAAYSVELVGPVVYSEKASHEPFIPNGSKNPFRAEWKIRMGWNPVSNPEGGRGESSSLGRFRGGDESQCI